MNAMGQASAVESDANPEEMPLCPRDHTPLAWKKRNGRIVLACSKCKLWASLDNVIAYARRMAE